MTTERFTTATATAQKFAQELLTGITQNVIRRTNNVNNAMHVSVEAEESPRNRESQAEAEQQPPAYWAACLAW